MDTFADQDESYIESVLPPACKARVAVEAASPFSWYRWVGDCGLVIGMTDFGASAPAKDVYAHFGITADAVAQAARDSLEKSRAR
jgi:transketolase